jgi:hypothetical protein
MTSDKRRAYIFLVFGLLAMALPTGLGAQESQQDAGSADIQEVFSWLPQDTETVTVARGPFTLPASQPRPMADENRAITDQQLEESFETLPLSLFGFNDGLPLPRLKGKHPIDLIAGRYDIR